MSMSMCVNVVVWPEGREVEFPAAGILTFPKFGKKDGESGSISICIYHKKFA